MKKSIAFLVVAAWSSPAAASTSFPRPSTRA